MVGSPIYQLMSWYVSSTAASPCDASQPFCQINKGRAIKMYLLDPGDLDDIQFKDHLCVVTISLSSSAQANSLRVPVLQY